MPRRPSPRVGIGRARPLDEERQVRGAFRVVDPGAAPGHDPTVRQRPRSGLQCKAEPLDGHVDRVIAEAQREPPITVSDPVGDRLSEHRGRRNLRIDDRDQLEIPRIAERDDPIRSSPTRVDAAGHRPEPVRLVEPRCGRIEITNRVDDVVDPEAHAPDARLKYATVDTPPCGVGWATTDTSSHPSSPNVFKISPGLCQSNGATKYSHLFNTRSPSQSLASNCSRTWRMHTPMITSRPPSVAMAAASSLTMSSCSHSTFAPIATASRATSGVCSARRNTSTTSTGRSAGRSRSDA